MGFFNNFVNSCADELLVKLSKYREFPEEQYEVAVENRKLKDELAIIKSSKYDELLEENKRIRDEIDEMRKSRITQLEIENTVLKLEMANGGYTKQSANLLLEVTEEPILNPFNIVRFLYIGGLFKYMEYFNSNAIKLTQEKYENTVKQIFPEANLTFTENKIHLQISNYDGSYINHKIINSNTFVNVEEIDDWIEDNIRFRKHSKKQEKVLDGSWMD